MNNDLKIALGVASVIAGLFALGHVADKALQKRQKETTLIVSPSLGREM